MVIIVQITLIIIIIITGTLAVSKIKGVISIFYTGRGIIKSIIRVI
jgi:hypothetical protein